MTIQTHICGHIAEILEEVGKLPDCDLTLLPSTRATIEISSILGELSDVRDRVIKLQKLFEEGI